MGPILKIGDMAPSVSLVDSEGRAVDLAGKPAFLSFHRNVACPWCNFHVHQLVTRHAKLAHLTVVAVFESKVDDLKKAAALHKPPFVLATDPSGKAYDDFAIDHSLAGLLKAPFTRFSDMKDSLLNGRVAKRMFDTSLTRLPADFVIDASGKIRLAYYGKDPGDHVAFEALEKVVA